ncbi:Uncaracterized surface protein containing fasciclin (FAS1) repeats [Maribacter aquivivus]|uniref:Uncaracterized surface protein containing fasciclin (FAS1) repeats n=1 Tax=Maribacter aquivivus TaxID=228958 RepID=A0A1M6TME8_9FLAO|nr:fasciclin domain-containing protein [Maribacter aquivivus]SHK58083.1 Uncaracterized surface protein containing fasciclin (FAS1) repeats [Maribacter aquivivus]
MKTFRILSISLSMLALIGFSSCDDDDIDGSDTLIGPGTVDTRINTIGSLSNLNAAIDAASGDIATTLNGTGPFTVFAPNDAAFETFATQIGFEANDDESAAAQLLSVADADLLAQILTYHVVADNIEASGFSDGQTLTTVQGGSLSVAVGEDVFILDASNLPETNPVSKVTQPNFYADNGIVHVIDKVLLPQEAIDALDFDIRPTLLDWVTGTDDLSSLAAAATKAGLVDAIADLETARVLAPNNQAFENLFDALGDDYNDLDDFDNSAEIELLSNILLYHILPSDDGSTDLVAGPTMTLLEDSTVEVVDNAGAFEFGDVTATNAAIVTDGIDSKNGVVSIVDKVLLPQAALDFIALLGSDDLATTVVNAPSLSTLEEALIATDLVDVFVDATNMEDEEATNFTYSRNATVFAPSNDAFVDLFNTLGPDYTSIASFDTEEELELLTNILLYHVVAGKITSADLAAGSLTTLSEKDLEVISVIGSENFVIGDATNDVNANITTPDVLARNGVAHIVDKVLLPQTAITFIDSLDD